MRSRNDRERQQARNEATNAPAFAAAYRANGKEKQAQDAERRGAWKAAVAGLDDAQCTEYRRGDRVAARFDGFSARAKALRVLASAATDPAVAAAWNAHAEALEAL